MSIGQLRQTREYSRRGSEDLGSRIRRSNSCRRHSEGDASVDKLECIEQSLASSLRAEYRRMTTSEMAASLVDMQQAVTTKLAEFRNPGQPCAPPMSTATAELFTASQAIWPAHDVTAKTRPSEVRRQQMKDIRKEQMQTGSAGMNKSNSTASDRHAAAPRVDVLLHDFKRLTGALDEMKAVNLPASIQNLQRSIEAKLSSFVQLGELATSQLATLDSLTELFDEQSVSVQQLLETLEKDMQHMQNCLQECVKDVDRADRSAMSWRPAVEHCLVTLGILSNSLSYSKLHRDCESFSEDSDLQIRRSSSDLQTGGAAGGDSRRPPPQAPTTGSDLQIPQSSIDLPPPPLQNPSSVSSLARKGGHVLEGCESAGLSAPLFGPSQNTLRAESERGEDTHCVESECDEQPHDETECDISQRAPVHAAGTSQDKNPMVNECLDLRTCELSKNEEAVQREELSETEEAVQHEESPPLSDSSDVLKLGCQSRDQNGIITATFSGLSCRSCDKTGPTAELHESSDDVGPAGPQDEDVFPVANSISSTRPCSDSDAVSEGKEALTLTACNEVICTDGNEVGKLTKPRDLQCEEAKHVESLSLPTISDLQPPEMDPEGRIASKSLLGAKTRALKKEQGSIMPKQADAATKAISPACPSRESICSNSQACLHVLHPQTPKQKDDVAKANSSASSTQKSICLEPQVCSKRPRPRLQACSQVGPNAESATSVHKTCAFLLTSEDNTPAYPLAKMSGTLPTPPGQSSGEPGQSTGERSNYRRRLRLLFDSNDSVGAALTPVQRELRSAVLQDSTPVELVQIVDKEYSKEHSPKPPQYDISLPQIRQVPGSPPDKMATSLRRCAPTFLSLRRRSRLSALVGRESEGTADTLH